MLLSVGLIELLLVSASFTQVNHLPIPVVVGEVQSIGGEAGFCPSEKIQQSLITQLSRDSGYLVQTAPSLKNQSTLLITGSADCSLSQRLRRGGFSLSQERFTITTAAVSLQLQLVDSATGESISTIEVQGHAQSEVQTSNALGIQTEELGSQAEALFSQATGQAIEQAVLQLKPAIAEPSE